MCSIPYGEATAKRCHSPGTPLSSCAPRSSNASPDPITRSRSVLDTSSVRPGQCAHARPDVHGDSADVVAADLALAGVQPGAYLDAERLHRVADRHRAADRSLGAVKHREEAISCCADLAAPKARKLGSDDGVMLDPTGTESSPGVVRCGSRPDRTPRL